MGKPGERSSEAYSQPMWDYERALTDDLVRRLSSYPTPWDVVQVAREFAYQQGRTDVVALTADGQVVAFEAKLTRWRDALHQAYRNKCFAHRSYVLLPMPVASQAHGHVAEFERREVGICTISDGDIVVLHDCPRSEPVLPRVSSLAISYAADGGECAIGQPGRCCRSSV